MRITKLEAIPVRVPAQGGHGHQDGPRRSSHVGLRHRQGAHRRRASSAWARRPSRRSGAARRARAAWPRIDDLIGPALMGADPTRITALRKLMDFLIKLNPFTKAAVEMALWDIAGKARGRAGLSAPGGQVPRHHPDQDDDRGLRPAARPLAGRAVPGLGRPVPEGEGRARPGRRHRARQGGARAWPGPISRSRSTPIAAGT